MTKAPRRPRFVMENGERFKVEGPKLQKGHLARDFNLMQVNPDGSTKSMRLLRDTRGAVRVLNLVNALPTPVCDEGTRDLDKLCDALPDNVRVFTVSTDAPREVAEWLETSGVKNHTVLSAEGDKEFGVAYGAWIENWLQLQRVLIVIGPDDRIVRIEYVYDQMKHAHYRAAIRAAVRAASA